MRAMRTLIAVIGAVVFLIPYAAYGVKPATDVNVVNQPTVSIVDTPASVGSYSFSLTVSEIGSVQDDQTVDSQIMITGVDINTSFANTPCLWSITRDTADIGTVGGITNSTTLFSHVAHVDGGVHHEFKEPARVSAAQAFHIRLKVVRTGSFGVCTGRGILRFTVD